MLPLKEASELKIPVKRILENYDATKKTIVIIDDSRGIVSIVEDFLKKAEESNLINLADYNILSFYDECAPFVLKETLKVINPEVEFAIVDIVLPGKVREEDSFVRMDGVDVAELLHKNYRCDSFIFFTGNVVSEYVDYMQDKVVRFEKIFDKKIDDFIVFKSDGVDDHIMKTLRGLFKKKRFKL